MGLLLDMSPRSLEKVLYFAAFVVTDPGETPLEYKQLLTDKEYREARQSSARSILRRNGAEAVKILLKNVDLDASAKELREELENFDGTETHPRNQAP